MSSGPDKNSFWIYPLLFVSGIFLLFAVFYGEKNRKEMHAKPNSWQMATKLFDTHAQQTQMESRHLRKQYTDALRLLLAKDHSLESRKIVSLQDTLSIKEQEISTKLKDLTALQETLKQEQSRAFDLEKTIGALLDSLEAHKSSKELGQEKFLQKIEEGKLALQTKEEEQKKVEALVSLHKQLLSLQETLFEEKQFAQEHRRLQHFHGVLTDLESLHEAEKREIALNAEATTSEKDRLAIQLRLLEKELDEKRAINQGLEVKLEESVYTLNTLSEEAKKIEDHRFLLEQKLDEEKRSLAESQQSLEKSLADSKSEQLLLDDEVKALSAVVSALREEKSEIALNAETTTSEKDRLAIQLRLLEKELDETRAVNQGLEVKLEESVYTLNTLSEEAKKIEDHRSLLEQKLQEEGLSKQEFIDRLQHASSTIASFEKRLEEESNKEASLAERMEAISNLEEEKKELTLAIHSLKDRERELLDELKREIKTSSTIRGELLKLTEGEEDIEEAFIQLAATKERAEKLSDKLQSVVNESKRLDEEKRALAESQQSIEKSLADSKSEQALLDDKVKTLSAVVSALRKELEHKNGAIFDAEQKKSFAEFSLKQKIGELEKAINALKKGSS